MTTISPSTLPKEIHDFVVNLPPSSVAVTAVSGLFVLLGLFAFQLISASDKSLRGVPELKGYPLLGAAHYYLQDGMPSLLGRLIAVGNKGISFARVGHNILVSVHGPELVKEVHAFTDDIASREGGVGRMSWSPFWTLRRLIGNSLFNRVGPEITGHRNAFIREFNSTKSNQDKFSTISKVAKEHAEFLVGNAASADVDDIRYSADNFAIGLWGETLYANPEHHRDGKVLSLSEHIITLAGDPWPSVWYSIGLLFRLVTPGEPTRSESKIQAEVGEVVKNNLIKLEEYERLNPEAPPKTIRSLSMATGGGRHGPLSRPAAEFTNLNLFGGHHSIGLNVTWAFIELNKHPEYLAKLRAEVDGSDLDDFNTVNSKMPYLNAVIMEINRLHPTVHATLRVMNKERTVGNEGVVLQPGMLIYLSYLHLHTSPEYWGPTAGEFDPQRFLGGYDKDKPFMAFGYGPRNCVSYTPHPRTHSRVPGDKNPDTNMLFSPSGRWDTSSPSSRPSCTLRRLLKCMMWMSRNGTMR